ncbi:hypothetical protein PVAG01_06566 [Phlyctema vagabunda]|uniref:WD40 repeat-like protein n=1 Tax=Phlyctema vagabunda TaxID=108571 RepID=A0ABR4PGJ0_9HELO
MTKETLDSDRINYLIWRYLLESDYRKTALTLQSEWNTTEPQELPFAPHVTNHALVGVLNRGLLYHAAERDTTRPGRDGPTSQMMGIFGALTPAPAPASPPTRDEEEGDELSRKRQLDDDLSQMQNGHPLKRARLVNGYENAASGGGATDDQAMDVDPVMDEDPNPNQNGHAYPSPEQAPSPIVIPTSEQAIQLEHPMDLTAKTTFLELADEGSAKNIVLMQCAFHPRDPAILAAAGSDALARMWTASRNPSDSDHMQTDPSSPPFRDLLENSIATTTNVTGIDWSPDGSALLLATEPVEDGSARLSIWDADGVRRCGIDGFESPILCPQWNPEGTLIMFLSPDKVDGAIITVIHAAQGTSTQHPLPSCNLNDHTYDIVWTSPCEFIVAGGNTLQGFVFTENESDAASIRLVKEVETREDHALCKVTYDFQSRLLATASETGTIDIWTQFWEPTAACHSISAHQGLVTSLIWQPSPNPIPQDTERLLASSGEDGAISIWNARSSENKPKRSMTMVHGVVGLSFTPDGKYLASATSDSIDIWNVDNVRVQRAVWTRGHELGWQTPRSNASSRDEDEHCLCWSSDGQQLAYGVNSMMAVINFPH